MHPLLVSAVANTAGNLLDRWSRGAGASPANKAPEGQFRTMLDARTGAATATPAQKSPAESALERTKKLREELLNSPEIRAVLDTADPTKPPTLTLSPDGRVLTAKAGYDPKPILLSPEMTEVARELAGLTSSNSALSFPTVTSARHLQSIGSSAFDLIPRTGFTSAR